MPALPARLGRVSESTLLRHLVLALAGMVVIVLVLESTSAFRNGQLTAMAYLGIAAGGLTVLTGLNGQLSLGHGAFMAIGAYTTALFLQDTEPALPVVGVLVVATLVTLLVGAVVGVAAARLHGPYLAGATLALAVAVPGSPCTSPTPSAASRGSTCCSPRSPTGSPTPSSSSPPTT